MKAVPSPVLDRLGLLSEEDKDPNAPLVTGTDYVRARVKDVHHKTVLTKREGTAFEFKGKCLKHAMFLRRADFHPLNPGLKVQNYYD